jgi:hypothetical protein
LRSRLITPWWYGRSGSLAEAFGVRGSIPGFPSISVMQVRLTVPNDEPAGNKISASLITPP